MSKKIDFLYYVNCTKLRGNWCNFLTFCTYRFFSPPWLRYSITPLNAKVVVPQSTFLDFFLPGNTHPLFPAHFFALSSCSLTLCCLACERHASKSREAKCGNKRADSRAENYDFYGRALAVVVKEIFMERERRRGNIKCFPNGDYPRFRPYGIVTVVNFCSNRRN